MGWGRLDEALVCTRTGDLSRLPAPQLPEGFHFREMDMADDTDVAIWLAVHNDAFAHSWGRQEFEGAILGHPHFEVQRTFFVMDGDDAVGAASIGVFRRNRDVGVGHYLGVRRRAQGLGLGRELVVYRYGVLHEGGITQCESHTHIGRTRSLRIHFECGFVPKTRLDEWNTPNTATPPVRVVTNLRLHALHRRWRRESARRP